MTAQTSVLPRENIFEKKKKKFRKVKIILYIFGKKNTEHYTWTINKIEMKIDSNVTDIKEKKSRILK